MWYAKFESIIRVQREIRPEYGARPPDDKSISRRYELYRGTGRMGKEKKNIPLGGLGDLMKM
jgi:hypothetical protein